MLREPCLYSYEIVPLAFPAACKEQSGADVPGFRDWLREPPHPSINGGEATNPLPYKPLVSAALGGPGVGVPLWGLMLVFGALAATTLFCCSRWG